MTPNEWQMRAAAGPRATSTDWRSLRNKTQKPAPLGAWVLAFALFIHYRRWRARNQ